MEVWAGPTQIIVFSGKRLATIRGPLLCAAQRKHHLRKVAPGVTTKRNRVDAMEDVPTARRIINLVTVTVAVCGVFGRWWTQRRGGNTAAR